MAQVTGNDLALRCVNISFLFKELYLVAARFLRVIHGAMRTPDQGSRVGAIFRIETDPDTGGQMQVVTRNGVRSQYCQPYFLGDESRVLYTRDLRQKHDEFITDLAAYDVGASDAGRDTRRHRA